MDLTAVSCICLCNYTYIESNEVSDVKSMLWARRGASVTGICFRVKNIYILSLEYRREVVTF
jgi:hypothetical protein